MTGPSSVSNSSASSARSIVAAELGDLAPARRGAGGGATGDRGQLGARVVVVHQREEGVVGSERVGALRDRAVAQEGVGDAVGRRHRELLGEERRDRLRAQLVAAQHRQQAAREQQLARGAQLRVAQAPAGAAALAVLRDEVDADRAPVADEVVEQEARRAMVAQRVAEVVLDHVEAHAGEHARVARRDRLEHEQHAASEVRVRVVVEADAQQVGGVDDLGEDALPAGRAEAAGVPREALGHLGGGLLLGAPAAVRGEAAHEHEVVVVRAGGELVAPPGAHQHDGGVLVELRRRRAVRRARRGAGRCARVRP